MFPTAEPITTLYPAFYIVFVSCISAAFAALLLDNYGESFYIRLL